MNSMNINNQQPPIALPETHQRTWGWTGALSLLLALLIFSLLPGLERLPWANRMAPWSLPAMLGAGLEMYLFTLLLVLVARARQISRSRRRQSSSLRRKLSAGREVAPVLWHLTMLAVAGLIGAVLAARSAMLVAPELGVLTLGAFCGIIGALLLWLVLRMRQSLAALALCWLLIAGTWNLPQPTLTLSANPDTPGFATVVAIRWLAYLQLPQRMPLL